MLPSHDLPGFRDLPALLPDEVAVIEAQTSAALAGLLAGDAFAPNTVRSYASALQYWDAWHRAAFGMALPLLRSPRQPVPSSTVAAFIAHHAPQEAGSGTAAQVQMAMPEPVRLRLHQLGAIGRRRAGARSRGRVAEDVPSLATIRHRVVVLQACHRVARLEPAFADDPAVRQALRALGNRASRVAPSTLRTPKTHITRALLNAMLATCANDGLRGIRDAALLHAAFHAGGRRRSELVAMRWDDLTPMQLPAAVDGVRDGYTWTMYEAKGRRLEQSEGGVLQVSILGAAADALDRWRDAVIAHAMPMNGPVWYRVVADADGGWRPSTPMIGADVWHIVRFRAGEVGLAPGEFGAHSLRSGAATTFLQEGGTLADASAMLDHSKLDTTRAHYDRRGVPVEALARLVAKATP